MKKILFIGLLLMAGGTSLMSQQLAQYTQFMYNKLKLNPGYAGSAEVPCVSCLHRSQWIGLEGAPVTSLINFHMPFLSERVGMGVSIQRDQIGPTRNWDFSMMYSYRIPIGVGILSAGIQGTLRKYDIDVPMLRAISNLDPLLMDPIRSQVKPNIGAGLYFEAPKWFFGISALDLIPNDLNTAEIGFNTDAGIEQLHLFAMAGTVFNLGEKVKVKPAALVKWTEKSPFDLDANLSFIFYDKVWFGATYRLGGFTNSLGESIDFILQYQINENIRMGVAYDFSLGMIRDYQSGTFEALLQYCFHKKMKGVTNPRYF